VKPGFGFEEGVQAGKEKYVLLESACGKQKKRGYGRAF
jgi:hypothetical protein